MPAFKNSPIVEEVYVSTGLTFSTTVDKSTFFEGKYSYCMD